MNINFNNAWKANIDLNPLEPSVEAVSLFDLIFYYDEDNLDYKIRSNINKQSPSLYTYSCHGKSLNHDVIYFNENMYVLDEFGQRSIKPSFISDENNTTTFNTYAAKGLDLALATFDKRSKPMILSKQTVEIERLYLKEYPLNDAIVWLKTILNNFYSANAYDTGGKIVLYSKDALLTPKNNYDFYTRSSQYVYKKEGLDNNTWSDYPAEKLFTVSIDTDDIIDQQPTSDIILSLEDIYFEDQFKLRFLENEEHKYLDGRRAYKSLCVNYMSLNIWNILYKSLQCKTRPSLDTSSIKQYDISNWAKFNSLLTNNISSENNIYYFFNFAKYWNNNGFVRGRDKESRLDVNNWALNPVQELLLKNTYVNVKATFYADYINSKDFNQHLNKDSDVVHKNILIAEGKELRRFDKKYTANDNSEFIKPSNMVPTDYVYLTRPYVPTITPSYDILTDTLYKTESIVVQDKIKDLIKESQNQFSSIGSLSIEPFEKANSLLKETSIDAADYLDFNLDVEDTDTFKSVPPIWFDPMSRKSHDLYNDIPIAMTKTGNLNVVGRIISPTIDEIWYAIKSIAAGRYKDPDEYEEEEKNGGLASKQNNQYGYPVGRNTYISKNNLFSSEDYSTKKDAHFEMRKHYFNKKDTSQFIGDPLKIEYIYNGPLGETLYIDIDGNLVNTDTGTIYALFGEYDPSKFTSFSVSNWVNNPNAISYSKYSEFIDFIRNTTNGIYGFYPDSDPVLEIIDLSYLVDHPDYDSKIIKYKYENISKNVYAPNINYEDEDGKYKYLLSDFIWSNKELESAIKGMRYNLEWWMRFIEGNFALSGRTGRINFSNIPQNKAAGSLYSLHRDAHYRTHTTVYDAEKYKDSVDIPPNSLTTDEEIQAYYSNRGLGVAHLENADIFDKQKFDKPNDDRKFPYNNVYPAYSVYLAADGQWHSTHQMTNLTITNRDMEIF